MITRLWLHDYNYMITIIIMENDHKIRNHNHVMMIIILPNSARYYEILKKRGNIRSHTTHATAGPFWMGRFEPLPHSLTRPFQMILYSPLWGCTWVEKNVNMYFLNKSFYGLHKLSTFTFWMYLVIGLYDTSPKLPVIAHGKTSFSTTSEISISA